LTSSSVAAPPAAPLRGDQRPRIFWTPPGAVSSAGREAVELAASAGLHLDPWQAWLLEVGLAEGEGGNWLAFEVAELLSRQNGKGGVLEAVVLGGLYLFGEQMIGWSAHEFKTCREGFLRVRSLIENTDELRRRVKGVRTSHGEEGIELLGGQRLLFMARSTGSGRGFTGDRLILDEAQHLGDAALGAILPTMSARPNPQVWYAATAPDKAIAPCDVLARLRRRALAGGDASLTYAEWSIDPHRSDCARDCGDHDDPGSARSWARANPALGIRITGEHVAREFAAMDAATFAKERLGVGNWPLAEGVWPVISEQQWTSLADPTSVVQDPVAVAADVSWDRAHGSIAIAGRRADGLFHGEVIEHRARTDWIVARLVELQRRWQPLAVVVRSRGPAGFLIPELQAAGVEVANLSTAEGAQACGLLYQAVTDTKNFRHLGQPELAVALAGADRKHVGDAWTWVRKEGGAADLTPLYALTDALWGYASRAHLTDDTGAFAAAWR
jgi:hypothetical protein